MEKDLNKLLLERDILKSKEELKLLRAENENLMQLVNEKIENARDNITEKALEKSMAVLDKIITWLRWSGGILLALVVFAGFCWFFRL